MSGILWRCECGHETTTPIKWGFYAVPRCHECATFELVVPGTPKQLCPKPMRRVES